MHFFKFFKSLFKHGKEHFSLLYFLFLGLALTGVSIAMLGLTIKNFVDYGFIDRNSLHNTVLKFVIFSLLLGLGTFFRIFSINLFSEKLCASVKEIVYKKSLNFPIKKYDLDGQSQWINFLSNDIDTGVTAINTNLSLILRNITMFFGAAVLLVMNSWQLSIIVLCVVPIILVIISFFGYKLRHKIVEMKGLKNSLFLHLNETISFIKTVKTFNQENYEVNRLRTIYKKIIDFAMSLFLLRGFFLGLMIVLMLMSIATVIYFGGSYVVSGAMTIGALSAFIFHSIICASSVGGIIESFSEIFKNRPIFGKLQDILDENDKIDDGEELKVTNNIGLKIENLKFFYINNDHCPVLNNINLEIKFRSKIAIIGSSGSGKSTIINLLLRFYDNYEGNILLFNDNAKQEIRNIKLSEYRNLFGLVQQEVNLFSDTLYNNLIYGCNREVDEGEIWNLLEKMNLSDFVNGLENKLQTRFGDQSIQISGGQKQRIGIVRALLKKPKILILDEATSALDNNNEQEIYKILFSDNFQDLTVIIVTHRLFNIQKMDEIIIMSDGRITNCGNHNFLIERDAHYKKMIEEFY
jgi:ATP-binding cassette subfamily B protein